MEINNWEKSIFAISKSIYEIVKQKKSILPVSTFVSFEIRNYVWIISCIEFWMVYWVIKLCCTQMNRLKVSKNIIFSDDVAFIMWSCEFQMKLKASNLDNRDEQAKELIFSIPHSFSDILNYTCLVKA